MRMADSFHSRASVEEGKMELQAPACNPPYKMVAAHSFAQVELVFPYNWSRPGQSGTSNIMRSMKSNASGANGPSGRASIGSIPITFQCSDTKWDANFHLLTVARFRFIVLIEFEVARAELPPFGRTFGLGSNIVPLRISCS